MVYSHPIALFLMVNSQPISLSFGALTPSLFVMVNYHPIAVFVTVNSHPIALSYGELLPHRFLSW